MKRSVLFGITGILVLSICAFLGCDDDDNGGPAMIENMILVPAGDFIMGDTFNEGNSNELPTRTVHLDAYWISMYEVTNAEYASILNWANDRGYFLEPSYAYATALQRHLLYIEDPDCKIEYTGDSFAVEETEYAACPVVEVSWYGAALYCNWLSEREGLEPCYNLYTMDCDFDARGYRLPTEAEWEKAAAHDPTKGGDQKNRYPWGDDWDENNCCNAETNTGGPAVIGSFPAGVSYYGVNDMAGNVWEWVYDRRDVDYYESRPNPDDNPTGPEEGSSRMYRGGTWSSYGNFLRSAKRSSTNVENMNGYIGFRIARSK
jgi:formylglycine-generating enzyme required for sulfatase activity